MMLRPFLYILTVLILISCGTNKIRFGKKHVHSTTETEQEESTNLSMKPFILDSIQQSFESNDAKSDGKVDQLEFQKNPEPDKKKKLDPKIELSLAISSYLFLIILGMLQLLHMTAFWSASYAYVLLIIAAIVITSLFILWLIKIIRKRNTYVHESMPEKNRSKFLFVLINTLLVLAILISLIVAMMMMDYSFSPMSAVPGVLIALILINILRIRIIINNRSTPVKIKKEKSAEVKAKNKKRALIFFGVLILALIPLILLIKSM